MICRCIMYPDTAETKPTPRWTIRIVRMLTDSRFKIIFARALCDAQILSLLDLFRTWRSCRIISFLVLHVRSLNFGGLYSALFYNFSNYNYV